MKFWVEKCLSFVLTGIVVSCSQVELNSSKIDNELKVAVSVLSTSTEDDSDWRDYWKTDIAEFRKRLKEYSPAERMELEKLVIRTTNIILFTESVITNIINDSLISGFEYRFSADSTIMRSLRRFEEYPASKNIIEDYIGSIDGILTLIDRERLTLVKEGRSLPQSNLFDERDTLLVAYGVLFGGPPPDEIGFELH